MRGVTPGAEPDAGSGNDAGSPRRDPGQVSSAAGPSTTGAETAGQAGDGMAPEAGSTASPDDAKGPAGEEAAAGSAPGSAGSAGSAGSRTARRRPAARRNRGARFLRELVILIVIALVIAVVIKTYAIQAFFIPSGSMENTLEINNRVLVNKIVYDTRSIHRGDIVVFNGDGWGSGNTTAGELEFRREVL